MTSIRRTSSCLIPFKDYQNTVTMIRKTVLHDPLMTWSRDKIYSKLFGHYAQMFVKEQNAKFQSKIFNESYSIFKTNALTFLQSVYMYCMLIYVTVAV